MRYSGSTRGGALELNELKAPDEQTPRPGSDERLVAGKKKADIDEPLMQDEQGSSLVNLVQFSNPDSVVADLRSLNLAGVHYFGPAGSKTRQLLEGRLRSAYFFVNESPLQPCNVFAPLGHSLACGLGRIKGKDGKPRSPGFLAFSNVRSVYVRPNSTFLDLDLRYPGPSTKRLARIKTLSGVSSMYKSTAFCILYWVIALILLAIFVFVVAKYGNGNIITFPRL